MGSLAREIEAYNQKYIRPVLIEENTRQFSKETKNILKKLEERIDRENNQLYQLIDEQI